MRKKLLKEMQKRIVRSFLDMLILTQAREEAISGYDVIAFIHEKFHILVSTGTVYSHLYSLERNGLLKSSWIKRERGARVYTLAEKGEETIQAFAKVNGKIQLFLVDLLSSPQVKESIESKLQSP